MTTLTSKVEYYASDNFTNLLGRIQCTLLVTTYQAGQLVKIGLHNEKLDVEFSGFEQAMGVAVSPNGIAVGSKNLIWKMRPANELALVMEPHGRYDACVITHGCFVSGEVQGYELAWIASELWGVNTLFSCVCKFDDQFSFIPQWLPPFVSSLAAEDRCHLNGFAIADDAVLFATALAQTDSPRAWREHKVSGGIVINVLNGQIIASGLSMPHSPRFYRGELWVLDSGRGNLVQMQIHRPVANVIASLPGYCRGLTFFGDYAFVGLSKVRETAVFGGIPIAANNAELKCGLAVVNLVTGKLEAVFEFFHGVHEIFDVQLVPQVRNLAIFGPSPVKDGLKTIWMVPNPE